jgi:hypothetical protein
MMISVAIDIQDTGSTVDGVGGSGNIKGSSAPRTHYLVLLIVVSHSDFIGLRRN